MTKKPQIDKFRDKARELGVDKIDPKEFDAALHKIATANPDPKDIDNLAEMIGQKEPSGTSKKPSKR